MQWLAALCVKRPVFATVLILSLTVIGAFSFTRLGVDRFPKVDFPTVLVTTVQPGAAPEQIETEISDKIEHFGAYALLAFLPAIHERMQRVLAAALCIAALGVGLEFGQRYAPGRSFEIADMIAEGLGIGFGLAVGIPLRGSFFLCTPGK